MRVMLLESDRRSADDAVRALRDAGHDVVRCHEVDLPSFPCNALCDEQTCPLEGGEGVDVVLDHRAHPYPRPTSFEDGVVCAIRRHIPLVVSGTSALNPFSPWTTAVTHRGDDDVVEACELAADANLVQLAEPALAEVRRRIGDPTLAADADVRVHRRRTRLEATICLPAGTPPVDEQVSVAVAGILRAHDPYSSLIDVAVVRDGVAT